MIKTLNIEGVDIKSNYNINGDLVIVVNSQPIKIAPDTISQAWVLKQSDRYDLIKSEDGWKATVYNNIIKTGDIHLIALLLSEK